MANKTNERTNTEYQKYALDIDASLCSRLLPDAVIFSFILLICFELTAVSSFFVLRNCSRLFYIGMLDTCTHVQYSTINNIQSTD